MIFPTTHWSLLAQASGDGSPQSRKALEELCGRYWGPIHGFILSRRIPDPEAQDLTQDFMVHLLQKSFFVRGDPLRGRFRSFLLGALVRFLADAEDRRTAQKRGGALLHVSLEGNDFDLAGRVADTPDGTAWALAFDREWALTILEAALERVRREYASRQGPEFFTILKEFLPGPAPIPPYDGAARRLGISVAALKSEVHRLRCRFRESVRDEVAQTVSAPHEVEAELLHLQKVLSERDCELAAEPKPGEGDS